MDHQVKAREGYLNAIAGSAREKAELVSYVEQLGKGKILEVGPGAGTALKEIVKCIEEGFSAEERPEVIVFDIIADVFDRVRETIGHTDVKIDYVVGDGAKALPFEDASIAAVNLSAVAHECFSYGGGYSGIHRLARECGRILQPSGILTYRDPDGIELHSMEEARFSTPLARRFLAYFLPKFLDRRYTKLSNKVDLGYEETLSILIDGKPISIQGLMDLSEEDLTSSCITIKAKAGLIHEIQRHLVLFIKELSKTGVSRESGDEEVGSQASFSTENDRAADAVEDFLQSNGIAFERGHNNFRVTLSGLNLLWQELQAIAEVQGSKVIFPGEVAKILDWGKREGEENYFYGSCEEVVARFAHFSLVKDGSGQIGYSCLCPISTDHIKSVDREANTRFLKDHMERTAEEALQDRKRHIHFAKMPIESAFPLLLDYYRVNRHPALLETLQALMFILREFTGLQSDLDQVKTEPGRAVEECVDLCSSIVSQKTINTGVIAVKSVLGSPHLGLIGGIASGKSTIGRILDRHGYKVISFSDFIRDELDSRGIKNPTREDYFQMANAMRRERSRDILARLAIQKVVGEGIDKFIFDGMRNPEEVDFLRRFVRDFVLIGVETATEERIRRVQVRLRDIDPMDREKILGDIDREFFDPSPDGCRLSQVMSLADVYVNGNLTPEQNKEFIENLKLPYPTNI